MMSPQMKQLSNKYSERLITDRAFGQRVRLIYRVMCKIAPDRNRENTKAEAYILACILEETHIN